MSWQQEMLANHSQNVYSERGVVTTMSNGSTGVEINTGQPSRLEQQLKQREKPLAEDEATNEEAKEGVRQFAKEEVDNKEAVREGRQPKVSAEKLAKRKLVAAVDIARYFDKENIPQEGVVFDAVRDFCVDAAGKSLQDLKTEFLVRQYLRLKRIVEQKNKGLGFLKKIEEELTTRRKVKVENLVDKVRIEKAIEVEDAWRRAVKEGRVTQQEAEYGIKKGILPLIAGGAEGIASDPNWSEQLRQEVAGLNAALDLLQDNEFAGQLDELSKAYVAVAKLSVADAEKAEAMRRIRQRIDALQAQARQQGEENIRARDYQAEQQRQLERMALKEEDANTIDPDTYTFTNIKTIANEIKERVREGQANNDYLREKVDQLGRSRRDPALAETELGVQQAQEAGELLFKVQQLKELLASRSREKRMESTPISSFYGEFRQFPAEKRELVALALQGTPEANKEIERRFNMLFNRADIRSNDDWRDAMGQAGSIEVDDFLQALSAVASGRITVDQRPLLAEQRAIIDSIVRRLTEEAKLREYLHSITFYVNQGAGTEDVFKVAGTFRSEAGDKAFRTPGVNQALHFYEQAMLQVMAKYGGYLPYEAMINTQDGKYGEVESIVWAQMQAAKQAKILPFDMEEWEMRRAISLARGMGIVTARTFEIVAKAGIARGGPLVSWWANDIIKNMAFFRQVARYDVGKERNKFLAYKLEGGASPWTTKELKEIAALNTEEILDRFVNEKDENGNYIDDRYIDMINPFRIGSIFTQTGWRYKDEKVNHAGAIAHILDGDPGSTIIGAGMWIERERGNIGSNKELSADQQAMWTNIHGRPIRTEGERAEANIRRNVELAADITPLKFFYNLDGLRQDVLRNRQALEQLYGVGYVQEPVRGQILIKSPELQDDLSKLALVQEKLLSKRNEAYKAYLKARYEDGNEQAQPPNLLSPEFTQFDFSDLDQAQAGRVQQLAGVIRNTFLQNNHYERLIRNIREKGWKIPYVFGTDDLPYDIYNFTATGGTSLKRRWGDINSAAKGAAAYEQLIMNMANFQDQDSIIKALFEVYNNLRGHDEGVTREVMARTVEGIAKFYKKDIIARLPFGIGEVTGFLGGDASFAQIAFGRNQMAWDELDIQAFLHRARGAGLITREQQDQLKKRTGSEAWNLALAMTRSGVSLFILAFVYFMLTKELEGLNK